MNTDFQQFAKVTQWLLDTFFSSPLLIIILLAPIIIRIGLSIAGFAINMIGAAVTESIDKPKREQPVSFFEIGVDESDVVAGFNDEGKLLYTRKKTNDVVVGFGDDGELVYASEKPKRKNDEVVE